MYNEPFPKQKLIEILIRILKTDVDLSFLNKLDKNELETLVACVRGQADDIGQNN